MDMKEIFAIAILIVLGVLVAVGRFSPEDFMKIVILLIGAVLGYAMGYIRGQKE